MASKKELSVEILDIISSAVVNKDVDSSKLGKLIEFHERVLNKNAEIQFSTALSAMQNQIPAIEKSGKHMEEGEVKWTFAVLDDELKAIRPALKKNGLSLLFKINNSVSEVSITGVLMHKGGHKESTTITLPADISGSKNGPQSICSSVSYGRRYTLDALLNLSAFDDDAQSLPANDEPAEVESSAYPEEQFQNNLPKWKNLIESGKRSAEEVITTVETKAMLSEGQKKTIQQIGAAA